MLGARGADSSQCVLLGTNLVHNKESLKSCTLTFWDSTLSDFLSHLRAADCSHSVSRRNTVKELLLMKRQKWNLALEENALDHKSKAEELQLFAADTVPPLPLEPQEPPYSTLVTPPAPQSGCVGPQPQSAEVKMTLFHWQIQQEAQRIGRVPPELLNTQDGDGDTFLHIAVAKGRRALAYVLASKMAASGCLDLKERNGQTALQIAAATNQHLIVQDLLTHGAQVNTRDLWGRSPLHVCAEKGHFLSLQSIWGTLVGSKRHIDVEMFNYDGLTPLHTAVLSHNAVVKELQKLGAPPSYEKLELLQRRKLYTECIKILLLMGALAGTKDLKSGRTSLHIASEEANVELLSIFLDQPSSPTFINAATFNGNTALHVVCSLQSHGSQVEAAKLLVRRGADPATRNTENELPSQLVPEGPAGEKVLHILKGRYFHV